MRSPCGGEGRAVVGRARAELANCKGKVLNIIRAKPTDPAGAGGLPGFFHRTFQRHGLNQLLLTSLKPVFSEPRLLGCQGRTAILKRPQNQPAHRPHVGPPASLLVGLDMTGPRDGGAAQCGKVQVLGVDAPENGQRFLSYTMMGGT